MLGSADQIWLEVKGKWVATVTAYQNIGHTEGLSGHVSKVELRTFGKGGKVECRARPPMPIGCPEMTRVPGV